MSEEELGIWVFVEREETVDPSVLTGQRSAEDTGGGYGTQIAEKVSQILKRERVPLDAQALKSQMKGLMHVVGDLFDQAEQSESMHLDEVTLSVEMNAEGQIGIVGNGGKLSNAGGITMKFTRPKQ